jgi:hypothetical protein
MKLVVFLTVIMFSTATFADTFAMCSKKGKNLGTVSCRGDCNREVMQLHCEQKYGQIGVRSKILANKK